MMLDEQGVTVTARTVRGRVVLGRYRLPTAEGCKTAEECAAVLRATGAHVSVLPVNADNPNPAWREVSFFSKPKKVRKS